MGGTLLAQHLKLKDTGVAVGIVHPGAVDTAMTRRAVGPAAAKFRSPDSAATALLNVMSRINMSNTGTFWRAPQACGHGDDFEEQTDAATTIPW